MITSYRELRVDTEARITSARPGEPCTSVSAPNGRKAVSATKPDYFNPAIARKISKEVGCSLDQGAELLRDASNFLWLASQSQDVTVPSPVIDEAWHVFILFTNEYFEFCDKYCGGYVHHAPHTGPELRMTTDYVRSTVDMMYQLFGGSPSRNWEYISVKDWLSENKAAA